MSWQKQLKRLHRAWFLPIIGAFLLILASGAVVHAQGGPPQYGPPLRTITVVGRGSVTMKPDVAHTFIGVTIVDKNIKIANQKAQKTIASVQQALLDLGVAEKDIQTTGYSIHLRRTPEMYEMPGMNKTKGDIEPAYIVDVSLSVVIRDVDKVGDIMAAAIEAGANDIFGIDFSADNPDEIMAQARQLAAADARARAKELAALHGVAVGEVISISEAPNGYGFGPTPMFAPRAEGLGGGGGDFPPGQLQVTAQLQVVYAIKPEAEGVTKKTPPPLAPQKTPVPPQPAEPGAQKKTPDARLASGKISPITIVGDDDALLRKFVSYWFAMDNTVSFPAAKNTDVLLLGSLPDELPFSPDALDGMTILGSLSQKDVGGESILLEANQQPQDVIDSLSRAWQQEGITQPQLPFSTPPLGSFDVENELIPALFCPEDGNFWIELTAAALEDGGASVSIDIQRPDENYGDFSPCTIEEMANDMPPGLALLPRLVKPEGARVMPADSGGGPFSFFQTASIITQLDISDLADFYQKQLQEKDWKLVGEDHGKGVAWSEWRLTDQKGKPWVGSLLITKRFTQDDAYYITVRVERQRK